MSLVIQRESTEYLYIGVTGTLPTTVEIAFLAAGVRPTTGDWITATLVNNSSHPLWADAVASGATGTYFIAQLVGSFGGTGTTLSPGDYQCWIRLTGAVERPVRIAPIALEVA